MKNGIGMRLVSMRMGPTSFSSWSSKSIPGEKVMSNGTTVFFGF